MFKTRMLAKAAILDIVSKELTDIDILAAKANAKQEVLVLEAQKDLMRMVSILVSVGTNKNDDVFLREEILPIRNTGAHKPVNIEHNPEQIVGHMTKTYVTLKDGTSVANDDNNVPEDFDITNEAVIYKFIFPETAQFIKEKADENNLFVSIEMWFDDYDYLLDDVIVRRNADTSPILDEHLRANGGKGFFEGRKLCRVLRNCLIAGIGIVKNPANPESVIKSVSNISSQFVLIEDEAIIANVLGSMNAFGKVVSMKKNEGNDLLNAKAAELKIGSPAELIDTELPVPEGAPAIQPSMTSVPLPVELPVTPEMVQVIQQGNIFTPPSYPTVKQDEYDVALKAKDIVIGKLEEKLAEIKTQAEKTNNKLAEAALIEDSFVITADQLLAERDMWRSECERLNKENCELHKDKTMRERHDKMRELGMTDMEIDEDEKEEHVCDMDEATFGLYFRTAKKNRKGMCQVSTNNTKEGGLTKVVAEQEAAPVPTPAPVVTPEQTPAPPTAPVTVPAPVADPAPTAPVVPVPEPKAPEAPSAPAPQTVVAPEVPVVPIVTPTEPVVEPVVIAPAPVVDAVPSLEKVQPVDPPISVVTDSQPALTITQQMGEVLIELLSRSNPKWKNLKL